MSYVNPYLFKQWRWDWTIATMRVNSDDDSTQSTSIDSRNGTIWCKQDYFHNRTSEMNEFARALKNEFCHQEKKIIKLDFASANFHE
jgi:hypothetical protein